jgi:hypothetical protein
MGQGSAVCLGGWGEVGEEVGEEGRGVRRAAVTEASTFPCNSQSMGAYVFWNLVHTGPLTLSPSGRLSQKK